MATIARTITFQNDLVVRLTKGEITAIERSIRMNGSDPERPQYDPGYVKYSTMQNLARKGVMRRDDRGIYFLVAGLLPVQGPSLYSAEPFSL